MAKLLRKEFLFNVSLNTIYLKSLSSDETIAIPSNRVFSIKAKARTQKMKDFGQGCNNWVLNYCNLSTILERRELDHIYGNIFYPNSHK